MNKQQNSNEVSDDFLEWIDKVIKFSKEDIFVGGVCGDLQIKLMEQIRDKYMSMNNSIKGNVQGSKEINDEEMLMDKVIKFLSLELPSDIWDDVNNKYQSFKAVLKSKSNAIDEKSTVFKIKKYVGGLLQNAQSLIDKKGNKETEEKYLSGQCLACSMIDQEIDKFIDKAKLIDEPIGQRDYELLSRGRFGNLVPDNVEPIKNEELKTANEFLYESGIDTMSMQDDFNCQLFYAMERYAEQYAASKLNNTIEDKWIRVEDKLPEIGELVNVYTPTTSYRKVKSLMRLIRYEGAENFYWDNRTGGDMHIQEVVTHWQPLPEAPKK